MKKVSERLEAAREFLCKKGWVQGHLGREEGPVCAVGALAYSQGKDTQGYYNRDREAEEFLLKTISQKTGQIYCTVPHWNDDTAKDCCEVIAAFDAAIELARELPEGCWENYRTYPLLE